LPGIFLKQNFIPNNFGMKKIVAFLLIAVPLFSLSQNVGIGNPTPNEKLDVTGNINVTGTIKANGTDGTAGQVLMKNSSNILAWANICDYKNMVTFVDTSVLSVNWLVPAGVTKVWIEMWGGGGAGFLAGGGGGAYVSFFRNVVEGNLFSIEVGKGGKDVPAGAIAQNGGTSRVTSGGVNVNIFANGGSGAISNISSGYNQDLSGTGGSYLIFPGTVQDGFFVLTGHGGQPLKTEYNLLPANQYNQIDMYGNGGDAGNTQNTGGYGGVLTRNINGAVTTNLALSPARGSSFPGGGGGGSGSGFINTNRAGSNGMVIIHY
jgi:hypothetical protein